MLRPYMCPRLAYVMTEHPCEGPRGPRMARAALLVCIAGNDGEWAGYGYGDHLLRVGMNHDWSADPAVPLKALPIQPLTRSRPFQLGQAPIGSVLINVLDGGGLNLGHSSIIRIRLRCHVSSVGSRIADHLEHHGRFGKSGTVDVHHVQWGMGFGGERQRFL